MYRYLRLIILLSLFFLIFVGVFRWTGDRKEYSLPARILFETAGCLQKAVTASVRVVDAFWEDYFYLVTAREENKRLKQKIGQLEAQLNSLHEDSQANHRLKKLLGFKLSLDQPMVGGHVVAWDPNAWFKTIIIDRGTSDGLKNGMPVVTHEGVVGRIIALTPHYAKVLLVIDYNSSIDALVQRNRVRGILAGRSADTCQLKYVLKHDDLLKNDILVTSGLGGVFPKGLKLGTISKILKKEHGIFFEIEVTPAVNFRKLEEILVILKENSLF